MDMSGKFSERREQEVSDNLTVLVHKYKKPDDVSLARQALNDTKPLYEKRIRELLEEVFIKTDNYNCVVAQACNDTARTMTMQLRTDIIVV